MSEKIRLVWEDITDEESGTIRKNLTKRAKVPGGWIILTFGWGEHSHDFCS
jgi:hypothetical protein